MSRYNNLPDIDIDADDPFSPEAYRAHLAAAGMSEQYAEAPALVRPQYSNGPAPLYQEQDHGPGFYDDHGALPPTSPYCYPEPVQDGPVGAEEQYYNEKSLVVEDLGRYQRYATPELEGGGAQQETSFDGPDEYQSTADDHAAVGQQQQRGGFFSRATRYANDRRNANRSDESQRTRAGAAEGPKRQRRFVNEGGFERLQPRLLLPAVSPCMVLTDEFDEKMGLGRDHDEDDEEGHANPHYGPVPATQLRRNRTKKRVPLHNGNLIIEAPIPSRLAGFLPRKGQEEFDKMRCVDGYTHALQGGPVLVESGGWLTRRTCVAIPFSTAIQRLPVM